MITVYLDIDLLKEHNLSIEEYFLLFALWTNNYILSRRILLGINDYDSSHRSLEEKGWILGNGELHKNVNSLFTKASNAFDELLNLYPKQTPNGRKLHSRVKDCRLMYIRIIRNSRSVHEDIMTALEKEINVRGNSNSMEYMKNIYNWLNNEEYKNYM